MRNFLPCKNIFGDFYSHREAVGLLLLALALVFTGIMLAPEARIERVPVNDLAFHLQASQRLGESIARGEPLLDPWVSQWALGYPLWRVYQPLPHLLGALVITLARPIASQAESFAALYYLLLVLLPVSVYVGARLLGFNPVAAGFASILILAPSETGDFSRYGLGFGAYVWRGSGLYSELVALNLLLPTLGLISRALDTKKGESLAAAALALTVLSHLFFGYIAFVSMAIWAPISPRTERAQRVAKALSIAARALLLLAWFIVPMILGGEVNRSRWDPAYKFDSYGAQIILTELFSGRLLDFGRLPVLSAMVAAGAMIALFNIADSLPRRLLVLTSIWLLLFFGRTTWGHLLVLAGIPGQFHLHRLEAAFELFAILLAAWGIEHLIGAVVRGRVALQIAVSTTVACALMVIGHERALYLRLNTRWGESNLAAFERFQPDLKMALADVRRILGERPGRVSAGKSADWGANFQVGFTRVYSLLTREGLDEASFLYHTISRSSDFMMVRDENDSFQEDLFGLRAVLAPAALKLPRYFRKRAEHGRFAVYEASSQGYFSLVDVGARYEGDMATWYEPVSSWLRSPMFHAGEVIALDSSSVVAPRIGRWEQIPAPDPRFKEQRGRILAESKAGELYRATIDVERPCYALIKITYHPDLIALVDGRQTKLLRVSPDFGAIPLIPGHHQVEVRYHPGPLKPLLLIVGLTLFILTAAPSLLPIWERAEHRLGEELAVCGEWLARDGVKTSLMLGTLLILFTRALFQQQLIAAHDAPYYLPRLAQFSKAIGEHQLMPIWAPDLSNGHGQPLFEFASPLIYLTALPFYRWAFGLAGSLQLALAALFAMGTIAIYLIAREMSFSRIASIGGAAAWLFAPYQLMNLYMWGRLDDSATMAIAPVALLSLITAMDRASMVGVAIGTVSVASLLLGSKAVALLLLPILVGIIAVRSIRSEHPLATALIGFTTIAGGFGLSAHFWLPALLEQNFVKIGTWYTGPSGWTASLTSPLQLIWGERTLAHAFAGPGDCVFSLGIVHISLGIAGLLIALRGMNRARCWEAVTFAGGVLVTVALATKLSSPLWSHLAPLENLEYPCQTLSVCTLLMPLLALYALDRLRPKAITLVIALMVLLNVYHTQPKGYLNYDEEFYSPASIAQRGLNATTRDQFEPRWVKNRVRYTGDGILTPTPLTAVRALSWTSTRHKYSVNSPGLVEVMESTDYYPGWTTLIDAHETPVLPAPKLGAISFRVPPGHHTIDIELRSTPVRRIAALIQICTLGILLIGVAEARLRGEFLSLSSRKQRFTSSIDARLTAVLGLTLMLVALEFLIAVPATGYPSGRLVGLFTGTVMLAIVGFTLSAYLQPLISARDRGFCYVLIVLTAIGAGSAALVLHFPGFEGDIRCYESWARRIASLGPAHTYEPGYFLDYPPVYLYALWLTGVIAKAARASGDLLRLITESPALIANFGLGALLFAVVRREKSAKTALAATLMVVLNPALLYDTVVWGQCDSVLAFTMLLSIAAVLGDQYELCFAVAAISVLLKPQGLMLVPVLALWTLQHTDYRVWIRCAISFTATGLIIIAPFQIGHPWSWILDLYASTAAYYHETSVNAFNLLAILGGLRMPDSGMIGPISYYTLGMGLLVPLYAFAAWIVWNGRSSNRLVLACFITIFGFFVLAPRMHERYVYLAIVLAAPLALETRFMVSIFAILTLTSLFNIAYVLRTLQSTVHPPGMLAVLNPHDGLAMAVSVLNLVVLVACAHYAATSSGLSNGTRNLDKRNGAAF